MKTDNEIRIIIAGGRDFDDYNLLKESVDKCINIIINKFNGKYNICIVNGKAPGADTLGKKYAIENNYRFEDFDPQWNDIVGKPESQIKTNKFNKKYWILAGLERNTKMAEYSDMLIAFWDGKSSGTKHMIDEAKKLNLKIVIINYTK